MKRRNFLSTLVAASIAGSGLPVTALAQDKPKRRLPWRNWSGSQKCLPEFRKAPASVAQLQELVASSTGTVRAVGAGHSFTPLVPTEGTIVSLARMGGVINTDPETTFNPYPPANHGTAVLGMLVGQDNGFGVTGIVPAAIPLVFPTTTEKFKYNPGEYPSRVDPI